MSAYSEPLEYAAPVECVFTFEDLLCVGEGVTINKSQPSLQPKLPPTVQHNSTTILKPLKSEDLSANEGSEQCSTNESSQVIEVPEFCGDANQTRKRSKKAEKSTWKKEVQKSKRAKGESYLASVTVLSDKNTGERKRKFCATEAPAKRIKPTCSSVKCLKSTKRKCDKFSQTEREHIFDIFWKGMDWGEKKEHVISLVDCSKPKRRRSEDPQKYRSENYLYHLKKDGIRTQVCKEMFINTLGIGVGMLRGWLGSRYTQRTKKENVMKWSTSKSDYARNYLLSLPKLPSHYCRQSSTKQYLEPVFRSKRQLYKEYESRCKKEKQQAVSWGTFHSMFENLNIGLYQPKKDRCDLCIGHEAGNVPDNEWDQHVSLKDAARNEKSNDKKEAFSGKCHVLCVDVQAVQVSPMLNASALYYKTKLCVHNYTVYDLKTRNAKCYLFDETQGDLSASVFASCLVKYLERFEDGKPIIIYSDGCTNQNRNAILSTALLDFAIRKNTTVIQKFLVKGHTQMEVDSVHSSIERKLKNRTIFLPTDYVEVCKEARIVPGPYEVEYLNFSYFKNYSIPNLQWYKSIRPGKKSGDKCVTHLRQLRYEPNGLIKYKLDFFSDWINLPRSPAKVSNPDYPELYSKRIPVTKRKHQDLLDLLHVIPESCHSYYKNIPVI